MNLHSTVEQKGKIVTEILHFQGGNKRTIKGIISNTIVQGEFTKFETINGRLIMVNTSNVDMVEVFEEN